MRAPVIANIALLLLVPASRALASWSDPSTNLAVCTATNGQWFPRIVPDGAGGAIVTWFDGRSGTDDIYAQRVLASGVVAPAWPANGVALCTATGRQDRPRIASDGAGGAIVTWQDQRGGVNDIYAQHVLASGAVDPAWPPDGLAVCTVAFNQELPAIVPDGAGGAIIAWDDYRSGTSLDVYAQHVLASGAVDPAWPPDGRALCTAVSTQQFPEIVSDGVQGAIVTWKDLRSGNYDIYAQRVLASGTVDPAWPANGRALCTAANDQGAPAIVSDGVGGAIVTWYDPRSGSSDIYAQRVLASGAADPAWPAGGLSVCSAASDQLFPSIVMDGAGGAIVAWEDWRAGNADVYVHRVLASGAVDAGWPANGRAVCTVANQQQSPTMVMDGAGGAIVTWLDRRSGGHEIFAQRVLASGVADAAWPADGRALCIAAGDRFTPAIVSDEAGGAIVTWYDGRSGTNYDIYAQRVLSEGTLGGTVAFPVSGPVGLILLVAALAGAAMLDVVARLRARKASF